MLLIFLTAAALLLALCITTDRTGDASSVTITETDGDTREGYVDVAGGRVAVRVGVGVAGGIGSRFISIGIQIRGVG